MKFSFAGLPKSVRVGPFDLTIELRHFDDPDTWGVFAFGSNSIQLNPDQPSATFAADTVLHEIIHAIWKIYGLSQSDSEERIASVMATAWCQIYRDNSVLLRWLVKNLK